MPGYFSIDRDLMAAFMPEKGAVFTKAEAFTFLASHAAYAPGERMIRGKLIALNLGELVASERYLMNAWGWSKSKVRGFKSVLNRAQVLDQRKDQGETILILDFIRASAGSGSTKKTTKRTSEGPVRDQRGTKVEKDNKEKDKKNPPGGVCPSVAELISEIPASFNSIQRQAAIEWAEDKQSRSIKRTRIQSISAWKKGLKRMALYSPELLSEAIDRAIASNWQGWEQDNLKQHQRTNMIQTKIKLDQDGPAGWQEKHRELYEGVEPPECWENVSFSRKQEIQGNAEVSQDVDRR